VETPDDVVFTVEYSVRAAQMAVYELLALERKGSAGDAACEIIGHAI
jgi:myosin-crossreactive antigen